MTIWVGCMDVGLGQVACRFSNPLPPTPESMGGCYISDDDIVQMLIGNGCSTYNTGNGMTFTIDGNLRNFNSTGNQYLGIAMERCTLLFSETWSFVSLSAGVDVIQVPFAAPFNGYFKDCVFSSCSETQQWGGFSIQGERCSVTFENCTFKNATIGVWSGAKNVKFINCTFLNNNIGISYGAGKLDCNLSVEGCTFDQNPIGIRLEGSKGFKTFLIGGSTFKNGNIGINVVDLDQRYSQRYSFSLSSMNNFINLNTGVLAQRSEGISIQNQIFENCGTGVRIEGAKDAADIDINMFNNSFKVRDFGIVIEEPNGLTASRVLSNSFYRVGQSSAWLPSAVLYKSLPSNSVQFSLNKNIRDFAVGVLYSGVSHFRLSNPNNEFKGNGYSYLYVNSGRSLGDFKITGNKYTASDKIAMSSVDRLQFVGNTMIKNGYDINAAFPNCSSAHFQGNYYESANQSSPVSNFENGSGNTFCCNTFKNIGGGIKFGGTNPATSLNVTTFEGTGLALEETMIGKQTHTGNRWKGATSFGTLIGSEPGENEFLIKLSQGSAAVGFMHPSIVDPIDEASDWFVPDPDPLGFASGTCANNCGLSIKPNIPNIDHPSWLHPLDSIPSLGHCYPASLDRDGDGICDPNDPAPNNPCIPVATDTDGDGICDVMDPDITNSCNPVAIDTDNDGVCNGNDPAPFDPCIPNGQDNDGDGVCDVLDPDPTTPNPYVIPPGGPGGYTNYDGDGAPYQTEGYSSNGYIYSVASLEDIASRTLGVSDYDELNYIESMAFLYKILHTSPYYRIVSNKLKAKYLSLNNSAIANYFSIDDKMKSISRINPTMVLNYHKKTLYINRLRNVGNRLNSSIAQDSLYEILIDSLFRVEKSSLRALNHQIENARLVKASLFSSSISSLPTNYNGHTALKDFYPIYANNVIGKASLSPSQITSLSARANSCPLIYGEAVHRSREILIGAELFMPDDFNDNCVSPVIRNKKNFKILEEMTVYPNPTTGLVNFTNHDDVDHIIVQDIQGNVKVKLDKGQFKDGVLDLAQVNQSLSLLTFVLSDGQIIHKKIIVLK
jgi:hypothetical protein